jgi:hypothetical protein
VIGCIIGLIFSTAQWFHFNRNIGVQKITVYNINGHSAFDLIDHGNVFFIADTTLLHDASKIDFHITPNRIKAGCRTVADGRAHQRQRSGCALWVWHGKSILQIYDRRFSVPAGTNFDIVIVSHNAVENLSGLKAKIDIGQLILDSTNSKYFITKLLRQNEPLLIRLHSVPDDGAFDLYL